MRPLPLSLSHSRYCSSTVQGHVAGVVLQGASAQASGRGGTAAVPVKRYVGGKTAVLTVKPWVGGETAAVTVKREAGGETAAVTVVKGRGCGRTAGSLLGQNPGAASRVRGPALRCQYQDPPRFLPSALPAAASPACATLPLAQPIYCPVYLSAFIFACLSLSLYTCMFVPEFLYLHVYCSASILPALLSARHKFTTCGQSCHPSSRASSSRSKA